MPESPVYLVIKNREEDAKKSYRWLRGAAFDPQDEIRELREALEERERNQVPFWEVIKLRASKMAILIGFGLATFQQMSGINVVIFYSTRIFNVSERREMENFGI